MLYSVIKTSRISSISFSSTVEMHQKTDTIQNVFELINASSKSNFLLFHVSNVVGKAKHPNPVPRQALFITTFPKFNSVLQCDAAWRVTCKQKFIFLIFHRSRWGEKIQHLLAMSSVMNSATRSPSCGWQWTKQTLGKCSRTEIKSLLST